MKTYTAEELKIVLDKHQKWLRDEKGGERADLSHADLRHAVLCLADLRLADLRHAVLRHAVLRDADLRGAYIRGADLRHAVLRGADLRGADLRGADLRDAYLRDADLRGADLRDADLRDAGLSHCIADNLGLAGRTLRGLAYPVWTDGVKLSVGCQTHLVHQWAQWTPDSPEVVKMAQDAPVFWAKHKTLIMELCK